MGLCAGRDRRGLVGDDTLDCRDSVGEGGVYLDDASLWSRDGLLDLDRSRGVGLFVESGGRTFGFRLARRTTLGPEGLVDGSRDAALDEIGCLDSMGATGASVDAVVRGLILKRCCVGGDRAATIVLPGGGFEGEEAEDVGFGVEEREEAGVEEVALVETGLAGVVTDLLVDTANDG